ncbi:hypothetical protein I4U23_023813 [Adineta vaga]|nr:hypothetical protein I4U23_023813 [Adineta vaga]
MQRVGIIFIPLYSAKYSEDTSESGEELYADARKPTNMEREKKTWYWVSDSDENTTTVESVTPSTAVLEHPVRISLFNAGEYFAYLKLNFILNNLQDEQEIAVPIESGQERDLLLPHNATHIRIRVKVEGYLEDQNLIDVQLPNLDGKKEICYLLAGHRIRPVYGLCAFPFEEYYEFWNRSR